MSPPFLWWCYRTKITPPSGQDRGVFYCACRRRNFAVGALPNWKKEKLRDYMALKIKEYWIIDRFRRQMTVFRYRPRRPQRPVIEETELYTTPLLPGFKLRLTRLLAVADMLAEPKD
jgi:Putative restriction endonuclease